MGQGRHRDTGGQLVRQSCCDRTSRFALFPARSSLQLSQSVAALLDARLLRTQIRTELERWRNDRPQESSLGLYASRISRALSPILESPLLSTDEKRRLLFVRLQQIGDLADQQS